MNEWTRAAAGLLRWWRCSFRRHDVLRTEQAGWFYDKLTCRRCWSSVERVPGYLGWRWRKGAREAGQ